MAEQISTENIHTTGDPVWLADVLRAAGLQCDVYPGAMQRGHGDFGVIWGVMAHHTGAPATSTPGPGAIANHPVLGLASQLYLGRDGRYVLVGVGIAWHAGSGTYPGIAPGNANAVTIGIEAENSGTEGWSTAQYSAYVTGVAAILNKLGRDSSRVIGHKEWAGAAQGKWDPGGIDMAEFRRDVAAEQQRLRDGGAAGRSAVRIAAEAAVADWLGARAHDGERESSDGRGRYALFEHGAVYWSPDVNGGREAFAVPTRILETWRQHGGETGFLGYPVRRHTVIDGVGDIQAFEGGVLYRRYGRPGYPVRGVIGRRWASEGYETGPLGWPTSDEYDNGTGGRAQDFEYGRLEWDPSGVVKTVRPPID